jgi:hypothetical protein
MSVSTIFDNKFSAVLQLHKAATGARISDGKGRHLDVRYDFVNDRFVIEADSSNIEVNVVHNKILVEPK